MDKNSEIIRIEIIRILNENGKIRGTELANRVIKKVGNEKTVYREISSLVETGEIEKKVHSRAHIEYELINLHESANNQLKNLHKEMNIIFQEIDNFKQTSKEENFSFHQRIRSIIHLIHIIQSIDSIMKLLSFYPIFKKDKMFSQIKRRIDDRWQSIMENIAHQPEEDFLNEIIGNLSDEELESNFRYEMPENLRLEFSNSKEVFFDINETYVNSIRNGESSKVVLERSIKQHARICIENSEDVYDAIDLAKKLGDDIDFRIHRYTKCICKSTFNFVEWLKDDYRKKLRAYLRQNFDDVFFEIHGRAAE